MNGQVAEADTGNPMMRAAGLTRNNEGKVVSFDHFKLQGTGSPSIAGTGTPAAGICARCKWGMGRPARVGWVAGACILPNDGGWLWRSEYLRTHLGGQESQQAKSARAKGSYM
jgi:hypothetical protein